MQYLSLLKAQPLSAAVRANTRSNIGLSEQLVFVTSVDDLIEAGTVAGNVITIVNKALCLLTTVDLNGKRIIANNSTVFGFSSVTSRMFSTGLAGEYLITGQNVLTLDTFTLFGNGLDYGVSFADAAGSVVANLFLVEFCNIGLDVTSATNILLNNCNFIDSKVIFRGNHTYIGLTANLFYGSPGSADSLIEFASPFVSLDRVVLDNNNFEQNNTLAAGIKFVAGFVSGIQSIQFQFNTFKIVPTSVGVTGLTTTDLRADFFKNIGITNGSSIASYYFNANAAVTNIIAQNAAVKVNSTSTTANTVTNKFAITNNRATYIGIRTEDFVVGATVSVTSASVNDQIALYIAKNSVILPESRQVVTTNNTNRAENVSIQCLVALATNDIIEVWAANLTDTSDITVTDVNLITRVIT